MEQYEVGSVVFENERLWMVGKGNARIPLLPDVPTTIVTSRRGGKTTMGKQVYESYKAESERLLHAVNPYADWLARGAALEEKGEDGTGEVIKTALEIKAESLTVKQGRLFIRENLMKEMVFGSARPDQLSTAIPEWQTVTGRNVDPRASLKEAYLRIIGIDMYPAPKLAEYIEADIKATMAMKQFEYINEIGVPSIMRVYPSLDGHDASKCPICKPYIKQEEKEMSTVDQKIAEALRTKREDIELNNKLAMVEAYGEDTFADGEVIKFEKELGGTKYAYAAIKVVGKWYLTGPTQSKAYSWDDLVLWLIQGVPTEKSSIVSMREVALESKSPAEQRAIIDATPVGRKIFGMIMYNRGYNDAASEKVRDSNAVRSYDAETA